MIIAGPGLTHVVQVSSMMTYSMKGEAGKVSGGHLGPLRNAHPTTRLYAHRLLEQNFADL